MPTVFDPDGVYPYQSYCETSERPVIKSYNFIRLENSFISVLIYPDLGGKVYSIIHKISGKEVLYVPNVIRPIRILPRFSFVAGGIEMSFPISHTPSQSETVLYDICRIEERIYVTVGETELRYGMQWTIEYSLGERDNFLTQRTVFKNPTNQPHPWMSWSNAAIPAYEDTKFHFPKGPVLAHEDTIFSIDWEKDGPRKNSDIKKMSGYFWLQPHCNAFGCYTPSTGTGLYHVADLDKVKGIKLWSYGTDRDKEWSYLSSLNKQPFLEIQAGPIVDQSIKNELGIGETLWRTEFWIPSDQPLNIEEIDLPKVALRQLEEIPFYSYARGGDVDVWFQLLKAYENNNVKELQEPPSPEEVCWPPSGMCNLEIAFRWAIKHHSKSNYWKLYFGVWLLGRGKTNEAVSVLSTSDLDISKAILGRVFFYQDKLHDAVISYRGMKDETFILHPQIMVERDKALAALGSETLQERLSWLDKLNALEDEIIIERRIALLIDMEKYEAAIDILKATKFQKIHQRYTRKKLWKKLCEKFNMDNEPYPENLGEDDLAQFGAYREFDER